eukprot:TRINITY_DN17904_c0_g1_i3.p1 TRINITY_DN17904_c0_g1~~TRINITY_DN17904_c0_g1_i3.p1  ORF type:complete len:706 (+),score=192.71 TRINITY_DN17904_c0_g1_i3:72-2120(+)
MPAGLAAAVLLTWAPAAAAAAAGGILGGGGSRWAARRLGRTQRQSRCIAVATHGAAVRQSAVAIHSRARRSPHGAAAEFESLAVDVVPRVAVTSYTAADCTAVLHVATALLCVSTAALVLSRALVRRYAQLLDTAPAADTAVVLHAAARLAALPEHDPLWAALGEAAAAGSASLSPAAATGCLWAMARERGSRAAADTLARAAAGGALQARELGWALRAAVYLRLSAASDPGAAALTRVPPPPVYPGRARDWSHILSGLVQLQAGCEASAQLLERCAEAVASPGTWLDSTATTEQLCHAAADIADGAAAAALPRSARAASAEAVAGDGNAARRAAARILTCLQQQLPKLMRSMTHEMLVTVLLAHARQGLMSGEVSGEQLAVAARGLWAVGTMSRTEGEANELDLGNAHREYSRHVVTALLRARRCPGERGIPPRSLAGLAHACGRRGAGKADEAVLAAAAPFLTNAAAELPASDVALVLTAYGRHALRDLQLADALAAAAARAAGQMELRGLTAALWGCARLRALKAEGACQQRLVPAAAWEVVIRRAEIDAGSCAVLSWSFAMLVRAECRGPDSQGALESLAGRAQELLQRRAMGAAELSRVVTALSRRRLPHQKAMTAILAKADSTPGGLGRYVEAMGARDAAELLRALGRSSVLLPHRGLAAALEGHLERLRGGGAEP